jgi:hypothetical protein
MTDTPIREDLWHAADHAATTAHLEGKDKEECVHAGIDTALSILSTALAERDARIAELEGALAKCGRIVKQREHYSYKLNKIWQIIERAMIAKGA